jgi:hypothetical protein
MAAGGTFRSLGRGGSPRNVSVLLWGIPKFWAVRFWAMDAGPFRSVTNFGRFGCSSLPLWGFLRF